MSSERTVVVVQARMGSRRLPGKVLMEFGGRSAIEHVLVRASRISTADALCCAIPEGARDDPLAAHVDDLGVQIIRGHPEDVLARYHMVAEETRADIIVRITGDCPLIDPAVCEAVIALRKTHGVAYANNIDPRVWPDGLDCEVMTRRCLDQAVTQAVSQPDREHVTLWMRRSDSISRCSLPSPDSSMGRLRWTLDTSEDLRFLSRLAECSRLPLCDLDYTQIITLIEQNPGLDRRNDSATGH